jgi:hypothetical protein
MALNIDVIFITFGKTLSVAQVSNKIVKLL